VKLKQSEPGISGRVPSSRGSGVVAVPLGAAAVGISLRSQKQIPHAVAAGAAHADRDMLKSMIRDFARLGAVA
jgi:hypothetical protein